MSFDFVYIAASGDCIDYFTGCPCRAEKNRMNFFVFHFVVFVSCHKGTYLSDKSPTGYIVIE